MQSALNPPADEAPRDAFVRAFAQRGVVVVPDVLSADFVARARAELAVAIDSEARALGRRNHPDYAMVLSCALHGGAFLELLTNERLLAPFEWILGEGCIAYAYQSSSMPPSGSNYASRIHIDCPRLVPGWVSNVGATILLDDFTAQNGATWFLPASFERADAPAESEFYGSAERLIAPAGSVMFFHARTWHAGGRNDSESWRHALTINMCRSFMKQRIDLPRAMTAAKIDISGIPSRALQKLGFHAQPPASYEEYYAPPEQRTYRQRAE